MEVKLLEIYLTNSPTVKVLSSACDNSGLESGWRSLEITSQLLFTWLACNVHSLLHHLQLQMMEQ